MQPLPVDHEDRPLKKPPLTQQYRRPGASERFTPMAGERFVPDTLGSAPPGLGERQIHADGVYIDAGQPIGRAQPLEAMRAHVAHRRVERVHDVKQADAPRAAGQRDLARNTLSGRQRVEGEVRGRIAGFEARPDDGQLDIASNASPRRSCSSTRAPWSARVQEPVRAFENGLRGPGCFPVPSQSLVPAL